MTDTLTPRDRYPGARPFADDSVDQRLFFGRAREAEELFHRIAAESLLVVYGKSGLGKTSLLQAGVFPRLRERELLPVPVRLNRPDIEPFSAVREALQQTCRNQGIGYEPGDAGDLWTLFKTAVLWRGDALQTPVLVLDQFEELFTLHDAESRRRYARALGDLLGGRVPAPVRERIRSGERLPFGEGPPAVKVVLSMREDYLGGLEVLAAELPTVLENRFRLTALGPDDARAAIVEPGLARGDDLASPPLRFTDAALSDLLGFLGGRSGIIEPFQLQVLCQHLEQEGVRRLRDAPAAGLTIDEPDLGGSEGMQDVLGNFYRNALAGLPGTRERRRARKLCEWGLLSWEGRRLPMEQDEIRRQYRVGAETLNGLVTARLLRSEQRLEGVFYELSHDTLAEPVLRSRRWRLPPHQQHALLFILFSLSVAILVFTDYKRREAASAHKLASQERATAEELIKFMTFDLSNKLAPIGRLGLLTDVNARVEAYYRHRKIAPGDYSTQLRRSAAIRNRGETRLALGDLDGAKEAFAESLTITTGLVALDPGNSGWQRALSESLGRVGAVKAVQGDLAGALASYEERLAIAKLLAASDPGNAAQRDLSMSLNNVGDIRTEQGDLGAAVAAYEESKAIAMRLAASDPNNVAWQRDLSVSLDKIGKIKARQGDHSGALAAYEASKAIRERWAALDPFNASWQRDLSESLFRVGTAKYDNDDLDGALASYAHSLVIAERLAGLDPSNTGWQRDLSLILGKVGDVLTEQEKREEAAQNYSKALPIAKRLAESDSSNSEWQRDLLIAYGRLGDVARDKENLEEATRLYGDGLAIAKRLAAADPSNTEGERDLAASYWRLGALAKQQNKVDEARGYWRQAMDLLSGLKDRGLHLSPAEQQWLNTLPHQLADAAAQ